MEFSWIDIGIIAIFLLSITVAVLRGFVKEVISLCTWGVAVWLAVMLSDQVALLLPDGMDDPDTGVPGAGKLRTISAFLLVLFGTWIAGTLINVVVGKIGNMSGGPSIINRILAVFFGFVRGAAVVVLMVLAMTAFFTSFPYSEAWDSWNSSQLLPPFEWAARKVVEFMPLEYSEHFPFDEIGLRDSS